MIKQELLDSLLQVKDLSDINLVSPHAIALVLQRVSKTIQDRWPALPMYHLHGPKIMPTEEEFDALLIPAVHPQRSSDKVHYLSERQLLRSHMTPMISKAFTILRERELNQAVFLLPGICFIRALPSQKYVSEPHKLDV